MPMTAEARPQDRAPASQRRESKCGERLKSLVVITPTRAERKWPRTELRGWARGDSIVLYSSMAAAPWWEEGLLVLVKLGTGGMG